MQGALELKKNPNVHNGVFLGAFRDFFGFL
jgi:hypothetical protein